MKKLLFLFMALIATCYCNAQNFHKVYGGDGVDVGYTVIQAKDGGYLLCGKTESFDNGTNYTHGYVIKLSSTGEEEWSKLLAYQDNIITYISGAAELPSGDFLLVGITLPIVGLSDIYVTQLSPNGEEKWEKAIEDTTLFNILIYDTEFTKEGNIMITGKSTGLDSTYLPLIKMDTLGNVLWTKPLSYNPFSVGYSVSQTSDNGFFIYGDTKISSTSDFFAIKTDSSGQKEWSKTYDSGYHDTGFSAFELEDGNFMLIGNSDGISKTHLLKVDKNGEELWTSFMDGILSIGCNTIDNKILILTGTISSSDGKYIFTKMDYNETVEWSAEHSADGFKFVWEVIPTSDGGYIGIGQQGGNTEADLFVIKVNEQGEITTLYPISIPQKPKVKIYPNPISDFFYVKTEGTLSNEAELAIFDLAGRKKFNETIEIPLSKVEHIDLPQGIFFFELRIKTKLIDSGKIIVK